MAEDMLAKGMKIRRQVLTDPHVDRALANVNDFNRDFQDIVTEYCWGACWGREGLSLKQRSINNICMLSILNRPTELETHLRAALRNGATVDEIRETLIQVAIYAGVPAAFDSFRIAGKVLKEEGAIS